MKRIIGWVLSGILAVNSSAALAQSSRLESLLKSDRTTAKTVPEFDNELYRRINNLDNLINAKLAALDSYRTEFENIKALPKANRYDEIVPRVKSLADTLSGEKIDSAKELVGELKQFSYTKMVFVPAGTQQVVDKQGYYENVRVPPQYTARKQDTLERAANGILGPPFLALSYLFLAPNDVRESLKSDTSAAWGNGTSRTKVKEGYNEKIWREPTYKTVNVQVHYKKIQVNPYSNTETVIEDNIPLTSARK